MEVPLLHNDAVQWAVFKVPAAAPVGSPCCARAGDVGGGVTPPSSSSTPHANTIVWCVFLLLQLRCSCLENGLCFLYTTEAALLAVFSCELFVS